jgi:alpha-glucosidase
MDHIRRRDEILDAAGVWPTTVLSNHDLPRAASRYAKGENDAQAKIAMALLLTLRGTPFMYYGEEIGMRDLHLRRSEILDPPGQKYWPIYKGRDGCRSPMQWDDSAFAGFSAAKPWLPVHPDYIQRNVVSQRADPDSIFNFTRKLLALRKEMPALRCGDFIPLQAKHGVLAYLRQTEEQSVLVAVNFSSRKKKFALPRGNWQMLFTNSEGSAAPSSELAAHEVRLLIGET